MKTIAMWLLLFMNLLVPVLADITPAGAQNARRRTFRIARGGTAYSSFVNLGEPTEHTGSSVGRRLQPKPKGLKSIKPEPKVKPPVPKSSSSQESTKESSEVTESDDTTSGKSESDQPTSTDDANDDSQTKSQSSAAANNTSTRAIRSKNGVAMYALAALVAGAAIAGAAVNRYRKGVPYDEKSHPLTGSVAKRGRLFSHFQPHAQPSIALDDPPSPATSRFTTMAEI